MGTDRARRTLRAEHHANVLNVYADICKSSFIWLQVVTDAGIHEAAYDNKEGSWSGTLQPANRWWRRNRHSSLRGQGCSTLMASQHVSTCRTPA